jgi:Mor family transcriptional regulator
MICTSTAIIGSITVGHEMSEAKKRQEGRGTGCGRVLLDDVASYISTLLVRIGVLGEEQAEWAGQEASLELAKAWGGQLVYVPMTLAHERQLRDHKVWAEFNGHNHAELAQKYAISVPWVYRIIRRMRDVESRNKQMELSV